MAGYVELAREIPPQGAHYLENHRGHLMFVKPEERPFVTAELIRLTTFTATEKELKERIAALADAGYTEIAMQIVPGPGARDRGLGPHPPRLRVNQKKGARRRPFR